MRSRSFKGAMYSRWRRQAYRQAQRRRYGSRPLSVGRVDPDGSSCLAMIAAPIVALLVLLMVVLLVVA